MAGIFVVFSAAILAGLFQQKKLSIGLIVLGLLLGLLMFWHHATDILKINL